MKNYVILNDGTAPEATVDFDIAVTMRREMNRLKGEFFDLEQGKVDYRAMKGSEAFREYTATAALLCNFPLSSLRHREDKLAFWINIYNTLIIHGIIESGVRKSVREVPGFFDKISYVIDGLTFTADDIEHGILRGNRRPPYRLLRKFAASDPRLPHVIDPPDPRIHFALVCGSVSCPPINYYEGEKIDRQLDLAAEGFINSPEVEILPEQNLLRLTPIFKWYSGDFGRRRGIADLLVHYLKIGAERDFLVERGTKARIEWKEYEWGLNG